jgi:hypothetical protein
MAIRLCRQVMADSVEAAAVAVATDLIRVDRTIQSAEGMAVASEVRCAGTDAVETI